MNLIMSVCTPARIGLPQLAEEELGRGRVGRKDEKSSLQQACQSSGALELLVEYNVLTRRPIHFQVVDTAVQLVVM